MANVVDSLYFALAVAWGIIVLDVWAFDVRGVTVAWGIIVLDVTDLDIRGVTVAWGIIVLDVWALRHQRRH